MGVKLAAASGGSIELVPTNTASAFTVTVPAVTATMAIDGPAFSAYQSSSQTLSAGTSTKLLFQSELYDTANCYDTSTSRFQPNIAGYYLVNIAVRMPASSTRFIFEILKNGSIAKSLQDLTTLYATNGSCIIYMNGSTDYLEVTLYTGSTGSLAAAAANTFFEAAMVRSA